MNKQPANKGRVFLPLGMVFLVLGITMFKDNLILKYIVLGASMVVLILSIYFNTKSAKENSEKKE